MLSIPELDHPSSRERPEDDRDSQRPAGDDELRIRYAASAVAVRKITVGTTTVAAGQSFPATGRVWTSGPPSTSKQLWPRATTTWTRVHDHRARLVRWHERGRYRDPTPPEAENGTATTGILSNATPAGASNNSSRIWSTNLTSGAFVQTTVNAPQAGRYAVSIRYSNTTAATVRKFETISGGTTLTSIPALSFPATTTNTSWAAVTVYANLNAGANTVKLTFDTGSVGAMNVDRFDITRPERRTYDQSGRLTQRIDTTGVNAYTWTTRDELRTSRTRSPAPEPSTTTTPPNHA